MYFDYFRAQDPASAASIAADGIWKRKEVDFLSLKSFEPQVNLGQMLAFALNTPWTVDFVDSKYVWPPEPAPTLEDFNQLPDDSPWFLSDYFLKQFSSEFRDALASLSEPHFLRLEKEWQPPVEFDGWDIDLCRTDFKGLVDLAKRAQSAKDSFFVIMPQG